jgi:hypothetical protein
MLFLLTGCYSHTQDQVHSIDLGKITEINVFYLNENHQIEEVTFTDKDDVKEIVDFLRKTEFKQVMNSDLKDRYGGAEWSVKLAFKGQRDQMYFFDDRAFIGKSTFLIADGVTSTLLDIIKD